MVNVGSSADHFFQTDAEIKKQEQKNAKYNYTKGDCLQSKSKILALLLPSDSRYAYIAGAGFHAKRVNLETKKTVKMFKGHTGPVTSVALSDDNAILWTGSWDKTIKKWDTKTGECLATLKGHSDFVKTLTVVGGHLYSGSADTYIRKWDLNTHAPIGKWKGHFRTVECIRPDPSGRYLYSASSDRTIRKWDLQNEMKEVAMWEEHDTSVYDLYVTEDELWSVSADRTARRWNTETGEIDTVIQHPDRVKSVTLMGPYVVTGSSDDLIRVFDIASGKLLAKIDGHFDEVGCLAARGSTLYSGSLDCSLRRWTITAETLPTFNQTPDEIGELSDEETELIMTTEEEKELAELMGDIWE
ncbi:WD40-repeat-containing domain protein [Syncephalastrum racemosum]|uniref:WD40-repeat-containing domain protein n=1 Tax=Syncephalastrum racemosum TaxID=13706 RepID=A0A1X2H6E5_SYNRA|nr:WD40-repeat-containing domain protein [Syncephalastrum racemosum]